MLGGAAAAADSELLRLAAAARMNTDVRRAVFCCVMGAEDATDAFERLLRLGLKVRVPILPASGISKPALLRLGSKGTSCPTLEDFDTARNFFCRERGRAIASKRLLRLGSRGQRSEECHSPCTRCHWQGLILAKSPQDETERGLVLVSAECRLSDVIEDYASE